MSTHGQDPFEQQLTATLRRHGQEAGSPSVGTAGVSRLGRQETTRRRGLLTGAVAAVAVLALAVGGPMLVPDPPETPEPLAPPTEQTAGTGIAQRGPIGYLTDDASALHVGGDTYPVPGGGTTYYRGGVTLVGPGLDDDPARGPLQLLGENGFEELADEVFGVPQLSADGSRVAWVEVDDGTARAVLHDLETGQEVSRVKLPTDDYVPVWVDGQSRVFLNEKAVDGAVLTWRPGSRPLESVYEELGGSLSTWQWPGGLAVIPDGGAPADVANLIEIDDDRTITTVAQVDAQSDWAPDGVRAVRPVPRDPDGPDATTVGLELVEGDTVTLLPIDPEAPISSMSLLGWQSSNVLFALVDRVGASPPTVWRCLVDEGACLSGREVEEGETFPVTPTW